MKCLACIIYKYCLFKTNFKRFKTWSLICSLSFYFWYLNPYIIYFLFLGFSLLWPCFRVCADDKIIRSALLLLVRHWIWVVSFSFTVHHRPRFCVDKFICSNAAVLLLLSFFNNISYLFHVRFREGLTCRKELLPSGDALTPGMARSSQNYHVVG